MKKNENFLSTKKVFIILCLVGFFSSFIMLGRIPGGVNQDEAYAGYDCLLYTSRGRTIFK